MLVETGLLEDLSRGLSGEATVESVVLFGSRARPEGAAGASDGWSDVDLHVISRLPALFANKNWIATLRAKEVRMHVMRPASGGVRKVTLIYDDGETDMVVISRFQMRFARLGLGLGLHRRIRVLGHALDEMSTIMRGGYRFLKGESIWGPFYAKVVSACPGQRLQEREVTALADGFLCHYLWVRQKLARGELVAAQRVLHHSLAETNFQLLHELRLRRGQSTFREARRLEKLLSAEELELMQVSARLNVSDLRSAADKAFATMQHLMAELQPNWDLPEGYLALVAKAVSAS